MKGWQQQLVDLLAFLLQQHWLWPPDSEVIWYKKYKTCYLKRLQSGLFLLQGLLFLLLIHAAEGHASGGEGWDGAGQGGRSARHKPNLNISLFFSPLTGLDLRCFRKTLCNWQEIKMFTWCLHSTPLSSCPPERPGAAPKPPGGCWGPGREKGLKGIQQSTQVFWESLLTFCLSHMLKKRPAYTHTHTLNIHTNTQHPELVGLTGR